MTWKLACALGAAALVASATPAHADEAPPTTWEQLFFPFPIVGAPPQLEQQVQLFDSYFRGNAGTADTAQAELGWILSPHLGVVVTVPVQLGIRAQPTGLGDSQLLLQYLAGGSLQRDNMLSIGLQGNVPTGHGELSAGEYYAGPFAYAAQRLWHRLILEADATVLLPLTHGASARQVLGTGLVAVMLTAPGADVPVYAQLELNSTTYLDGSAVLPPTATQTPAETLFLAPEIFLGPFETPLDKGTRIAAGVSFNLTGDPVHAQTYSITAAFDIPNKYGY